MNNAIWIINSRFTVTRVAPRLGKRSTPLRKFPRWLFFFRLLCPSLFVDFFLFYFFICCFKLWEQAYVFFFFFNHLKLRGFFFIIYVILGIVFDNHRSNKTEKPTHDSAVSVFVLPLSNLLYLFKLFPGLIPVVLTKDWWITRYFLKSKSYQKFNSFMNRSTLTL